MHSSQTVLVTGATGTIGSRVLDHLADRDVAVRAATRRPDEASFPADIEPVAFDFEKPETWGRAFEDVDRLFLVRPPQIGRVGDAILPAIDAAGRVGVEHVVVLSVLGAEKNPLLPHRRIEKHLESSALDWTFLRASFFMENLWEVHGSEIADNGEIVVPAGDGETSFVAADDVAAVAARTLVEEGHRNRAYDLTGPTALTYHEVASVLTDALDREVRYVDPSLVDFLRHSRSIDRPWGFALVMAGLYTTARLGLAGRVSADCRHVLGREPTTLDAWATENAGRFTESATSSENPRTQARQSGTGET